MIKISLKKIILTLDSHKVKVNTNLDPNIEFSNIRSILSCDHDDITFFSNEKYLDNLKFTKAKACLINEKYVSFLPEACQPLIVNDPYLSFAILTDIFFKMSVTSNGIISKNAIVNKNSKIFKNVQIDHFSLIDSKTEIMENVIIGSNCKIGPNVTIFSNCIIHDNVCISNAIINENCEIKSGAIIGGAGFGFEEKSKQKIYHSGNVIIKKNTSIGSNTTIDRAAFDSTIIGEFSNIDNLVQIAHNVIIGDYAIIAAQVGIAGSTKIGNNIKIGGQAGISGHLVLGNNITIAAKSGVTKNITDDKIVAGFPAKDIKLWKKEIIQNNLKK